VASCERGTEFHVP